MSSYDVAVIGAGVHGASAAFHLANRGVRPVVIERTSPAGGPTGRSSAIVRAYYTNAFLAGVARDSIAMFRDFERHTARDAGFRETGLLVLHPPEDEATVREVVPRLNDQGIPTDLLEPQQVVAEWPAFDLDGIAIAAFERDAGYADPVLTTQGLLERARELGAEIRLGQGVTAIERDGSAWTVSTTDGAIAAERVLIAAGPWSAPLAAMVGADLPLTVERHIVATFAWSDDTLASRPTATCRTAITSVPRGTSCSSWDPSTPSPPSTPTTSTSASARTRPSGWGRASSGALRRCGTPPLGVAGPACTT